MGSQGREPQDFSEKSINYTLDPCNLAFALSRDTKAHFPPLPSESSPLSGSTHSHHSRSISNPCIPGAFPYPPPGYKLFFLCMPPARCLTLPAKPSASTCSWARIHSPHKRRWSVCRVNPVPLARDKLLGQERGLTFLFTLGSLSSVS